MTDERDDYLWDRSGAVDPEIDALERALQQFRRPQGAAPRPLPAAPMTARPPRRWPWVVTGLCAAATLCAWLLLDRASPTGVELQRSTAPTVFATTRQPTTIALGGLAAITLRPDSELRFRYWQAEQALFELVRGGLEARVAPPPAVQPGFFQIETPLGRVVDQGCRYELGLRADGVVFVRVTEGAVTFDFPQRTVFVPAGAATQVTSSGPDTPLFLDSSAGLRKAVRVFDGMAFPSKDEQPRLAALKEVLLEAEAVSTTHASLVFWHLLADPDPVVAAEARHWLRSCDLLPADPKGKEPPAEPDAAGWLRALRPLWAQGR